MKNPGINKQVSRPFNAELNVMWSKRIYKCLYNNATSNFEVHVADENGLSIRRLNAHTKKDALAFFYVIRDTLATNNRIEINQIDPFHFECKKLRAKAGLLKDKPNVLLAIRG
jgi:hypothetical protein